MLINVNMYIVNKTTAPINISFSQNIKLLFLKHQQVKQFKGSIGSDCRDNAHIS